MNKIQQNIDLVNDILKRHERYSNFSGKACIIIGFLWLLNEGLHLYFHFSTETRIISWVTVTALALILVLTLTFQERKKGGKEKVTLALITLIYKFVVISIATSVLMYVFYCNSMIGYIPALILLMYGILILTSKRTIPNVIEYFGYFNLLGGVIAFFFSNYAVEMTWLLLGVGHIALGIALILTREK